MQTGREGKRREEKRKKMRSHRFFGRFVFSAQDPALQRVA